MSAAANIGRRAFRRREVKQLYGASYAQVDSAIRRGEIRTKKVGRAVFLHPKDVETVFGFEETVEPTHESMLELADFLA